MRVWSLFAGLIFFALFLSCSGKDGDMGPQGPQGEDGNANVQILKFDFSYGDLVQTEAGDTRRYQYQRSMAEMTTDVINNAAILVYMQAGNVAWIALPFSEPTWPLSLYYQFYSGYIRFAVQTELGDARDKHRGFWGGSSGPYHVRVVIIPPASQSLYHQIENGDIPTYEEIQELISAN